MRKLDKDLAPLEGVWVIEWRYYDADKLYNARRRLYTTEKAWKTVLARDHNKWTSHFDLMRNISTPRRPSPRKMTITACYINREGTVISEVKTYE